MDPNACLEQLRDLSKHPTLNAKEIADLFNSLDEWLMIGGFLPDAWYFAEKRYINEKIR